MWCCVFNDLVKRIDGFLPRNRVLEDEPCGGENSYHYVPDNADVLATT
jgi:hypothetical protein